MDLDVKEIARFLQQNIPGYGFHPTDEHQLNYLNSWGFSWGFRRDFYIIPMVENIFDIDPWNLPARFNEQSIIPSNDREWWFICPQKPNGHISRKTPCGYSWKITGGHIDIEDGDKRKIGFKKILTFGGDVQKNWVIHEYHLLNNDPDRYHVLCHLKRERPWMDGDPRTAPALVAAEQHLQQSDCEASFSEFLTQARMDSLKIESPAVLDVIVDNGLTDEYVQLASKTSGEDENVGHLPNDNPIDADFPQGDQMQTLVPKYQEHRPSSNLPGKTKIRDIEHAREKANLVTALTRQTAKSTKSSTNPLLPHLVNMLVGIFLLFTITRQVFNL